MQEVESGEALLSVEQLKPVAAAIRPDNAIYEIEIQYFVAGIAQAGEYLVKKSVAYVCAYAIGTSLRVWPLNPWNHYAVNLYLRVFIIIYGFIIQVCK